MKSKFRLSRRANISDYSLEDILAMDDDMLNLYITINNLDAESGAKVLEAVQYRPKYPRRVSVSVRASYRPGRALFRAIVVPHTAPTE